MRNTRPLLRRFVLAHPTVGITMKTMTRVGTVGTETLCELVWYSITAPEGVVCHTICTYTRERDARRTLRRYGYTQEGRVWRKVPKAQQAAA